MSTRYKSFLLGRVPCFFGRSFRWHFTPFATLLFLLQKATIFKLCAREYSKAKGKKRCWERSAENIDLPQVVSECYVAADGCVQHQEEDSEEFDALEEEALGSLVGLVLPLCGQQHQRCRTGQRRRAEQEEHLLVQQHQRRRRSSGQCSCSCKRPQPPLPLPPPQQQPCRRTSPMANIVPRCPKCCVSSTNWFLFFLGNPMRQFREIASNTLVWVGTRDFSCPGNSYIHATCALCRFFRV